MQKTLLSAESKSSKSPLVPPAISYRLSDKTFLDLGWTTKPRISVVYPLVVMRAKFSHPIISPWFRYRNEDLRVAYPNGSTVFFSKKNGSGKIYYPNGKVAVKIEKGGRRNNRTRIWVYSSGEVDKNGKKFSPRLCALFDSIGNGVVYDPHMNKRLAYNQKEVVWWDSPVGLPLFWKWHNIVFKGSVCVMNEEDAMTHVLVEPPKQIIWVPNVSADSGTAPLEKGNRRNEESVSNSSEELTKSELEFREAAEQLRYVDTAKVFPKQVSCIKPIVLQINKYLTLRILSQSDISLSFFTSTHQTTLKIGILYNPFDKLKVAEIDQSTFQKRGICTFESLPANTISMIKFKKMIRAYRTSSLKA